MQFLDKVKEKFQKKSIDQEIDAAFSDSGSYSKQVLESSGRYNQRNMGDDSLSKDYMMESRSQPQKPMTGQNVQPHMANDGRQSHHFDDPALPRYDDPYDFSKGIDTPPPKSDDPLFSEQREPASTPEERQEFFNKSNPSRQGYSGGMGGSNGMGGDDLSRIMLEIKDLRAQNDHIINLLKNIQDRLRGY